MPKLMNDLSYKKFCLVVLGSLLAFMGVVAVTNYTVDPYNRFGNNNLGIFLLSGEKHTKIGLAHKYDPALGGYILIGDSRGAHTDIGGLGIEGCVNCSYGGGMAAEHYHFIKKHVPEGSKILIGFAIGCNGGEKAGNFFQKDESFGETVSQFLLSLKSFEFSLTTVARSITGRETRLLSNGSVNPYKWLRQYDRDSPDERKLQLKNMIDAFRATVTARDEDMIYFSQLKELFEEKNIEAQVYLYPIHQEILEAVRGTEAYATSQEWKRKVLRIFPNLVDLSESEYCQTKHFPNLDFLHFYSESGISFLQKEVLERG